MGITAALGKTVYANGKEITMFLFVGIRGGFTDIYGY